MRPLSLQPKQIRPDAADEVRACIGTARLHPQKARVQLIFGETTPKRGQSWGYRVEEDEAVLGTFSTTYETDEGPQPVHVGFIVPRAMLPQYRFDDLEESRKKEFVAALADLLIADLERTGDLSPELAVRMRGRRDW